MRSTPTKYTGVVANTAPYRPAKRDTSPYRGRQEGVGETRFTRWVELVETTGTMYTDKLFTGQLGSASVITDASGTIVGEDRFYPFGETRFTTGTMFTDKLFTGQREIADLGIYHYGARFYSPKLGRFLSADTIVPSFANPQSLNRYSYVINNPLLYTDPTGHRYDDGNAGNHGSLNCNKYADYCNNGKPKTRKELAEMRTKKDKTRPPVKTPTSTPTSTSTPTPTPTATLLPTFTPGISLQVTLPAQQCTRDSPCIGPVTPTFTPTVTSTPNDVIGTVGANIDIAANTAVVGIWNYCTGGNAEPGCGETAEQAYPPIAPWGSGLDAGIDTVNGINNIPSRPATQQETILSYTIGGLAIPTAVIPLLIFFFAP